MRPAGAARMRQFPFLYRIQDETSGRARQAPGPRARGADPRPQAGPALTAATCIHRFAASRRRCGQIAAVTHRPAR